MHYLKAHFTPSNFTYFMFDILINYLGLYVIFRYDHVLHIETALFCNCKKEQEKEKCCY